MWLHVSRFVRKVRLQLERRRFRSELAEELDAHEALKLSEHTRAGLSPGEAAEQTRRDMGNLTAAIDQSTDILTFVSLEQLMQDIRYAFRLIRKNFGFSAAAILSLALGIGGNVAVFSMLNALLIKPLPFADSQGLVRITEFFPKALLVHLRQQGRTMDIASVSPGREVNVTGEGPAFRITASPVSANLFSLLGTPVAMGRYFAEDEDHPGRDRVAILSHELWTQRFRSDLAVIGRSIGVDGTDRRIVGIMPAGFAFPSARVQIWIPSPIDPRQQVEYWAGEFTPLIGRLRPGVTIPQAKSEITSLTANVWTMFPWPMPRGWNANATVIPLQTDLAGDARPRVLLLFCTVGAVLVIACANVAGLLAARGAARAKELAMRAALGAGRPRIVRQLLTESVVLAGAAGLLGLGLGAFGLRLFTALIPQDLPGAARIGLDWNVAAFTAALSLLAGISFGVAPALNAAKLELLEVMKSGSQRSATGASIRLRSWLIGSEVAMTLVLVIGAAVLLRSLYSLSTVNPGFDARQVLTMKVSPDAKFCREPDACVAFYNRLLNEGRGVEGVIDTALANTIPMDGQAPSLPVDAEDHPKTADFPAPMFWAGAVTPEYLRLMGIPLLAGRTFTQADVRTSEPVVLITASTAQRFWPGQNPIGKHIKAAGENRWRTVAGVVADVRQFNLTNRTPSGITGAMYMPYAQSIDDRGAIPRAMNLIVKTGVHTPQTASELHRFAAGINPNIAVSPVVQLERFVGESVSGFRSTTLLFLSFAGVALLLATIGIYGLVSYSVTQRAYEIALRMAIGATSGTVLRMVLMRSLTLSLAGLMAGLVASVFVVRSLSAVLFEVVPAGPLVYAAVALFLLAVTAVASLIPAWQASRIDPVRVLRAE